MKRYYTKTVYIKFQYCDEIFTVMRRMNITPDNPFDAEKITLEAEEYVIQYYRQRQIHPHERQRNIKLQKETEIYWEKKRFEEMKRQNAIDDAFIQLAERRTYRDMKNSMIHGIKMLAICKNIPEPIEQMIIKNYESMMTPSEQLADLYFNIPIEFHYNIQDFFTPEEILKFAEIIDGHETSDKLKEHENKKYRKFSRTFNYFRRIKQRSD